jgi:YggT family protein
MFVLANLLAALATVLNVVFQTVLLIVLVNAILSWVRPDPYNPIVMFLDRVSDVVCSPIRRLIPTALGGIDFAPFIAMLILWFLQQFLVGTLRDLAVRL